MGEWLNRPTKPPKFCQEQKDPIRPIRSDDMELNEYQRLASRTINTDLSMIDCEYHALHGMVGEIGEIHSLYQKKYQGHVVDDTHLAKELGDLLWFVAEYCTAKGWKLDDVAKANIDKLIARYPDGFSSDKSLHRKEGDV